MAAVVSFLGLALAAVFLAAAALTWRGCAWNTGGRRSDRLPEALVVRGLLGEWLAATAVLLAWPLGLPSARSGADAAARGVVVLLPDVGLNRSAFWLLARRLRRLGWQIAGASAREWRRRPEVGCAALAANIEGAERVAAGKPLIVLAHGIAGLAARECLGPPSASSVRQLVTLGTPHQGSTSALYRWLVPGIDPASERMRRVGEADLRTDDFELIAISSPFDAWTTPPSAADCPGAFNIELSAVGHFRLLFSRRVWELIAENLPGDHADRT